MKRYQILKSFKQLSKNNFYHRFASETDDKQSSTMVLDGAQLQQLLPHVSESDWQHIFESAECVHTMTGVKKLAIYANYVFWVRTGSAGDQHTNAGHKRDPRSSEKVRLEGYASLKGCYIEAIDEDKPGISTGSENPGDSLQRCLAPAVLPSTGEPVLNSSIGPYYSTLDEQSWVPTSGMSLPNSGKTPFMCKIYEQKDSPASEVLFFQSREQLEAWRQNFALSFAIFQDFQHRYECCEIVAKEGRKQTVVLKDKYSGQKYIAHCRSLGSNYNQKDLISAKNKTLNEAALLYKLEQANVAPNFKEMQYTGSSFLLITSYFEAKPFRDWFSEIWCVENQDGEGTGKVSNILMDLTSLLLALHNLGVAHGNISQDNFMVKCVADATLKLGEAQLQFQDAVSGILNPHRSSHCKVDNSRVVNDQLPSGVSTPTVLKSVQQTTRAKYMLVGFWDAVDTSSCSQKPDYRNPNLRTFLDSLSLPNYDSKKSKFAKDVLDLGKIFFDILFGVNIDEAKQREDCLENEFVNALLMRPSDIIFMRDPLYEVNPRIIELIGRMLMPDTTFRPTIRECYSELVLALKEDYKGRNLSRKPSVRRTTMVSRLSLDSYRSRISYMNAPSPILGDTLMMAKPKMRKLDSGMSLSIQFSLKYSPSKKSDHSDRLTIKQPNKSQLASKQRRGNSEYPMNLSVCISPKEQITPSLKKRVAMVHESSPSCYLRRLACTPNLQPAVAKCLAPPTELAASTDKEYRDHGGHSPNAQKTVVLDSTNQKQHNLTALRKREVRLSLDILQTKLPSKMMFPPSENKKNMLFCRGGDAEGSSTSLITPSRPTLEIQPNPFVTPPAAASLTAKVALKLNLRSRCQTQSPGKRKITKCLNLKYLPTTIKKSS